MTQKQEALKIFEKLLNTPLKDCDTNELSLVLGKAQNQVQFGGESDGSIDEELWVAMRDFSETLRKVSLTLLKISV